ncbi:uncharacterized protein smog isoform X2 [Eurosta solidaginis]|uniref:uncharacterized protein smog isoform X2 n=1 Tax=Eurosta solidaginis TaxID=178769 RepID=UPI003530C21E
MEMRGKYYEQVRHLTQTKQKKRISQQDQQEKLRQPTQRKCHQTQSERTNHLRLHEIKQQQRKDVRVEEKSDNKLQKACLNNNNLLTIQQQKCNTHQSVNASGKVYPSASILHVQQQRKPPLWLKPELLSFHQHRFPFHVALLAPAREHTCTQPTRPKQTRTSENLNLGGKITSPTATMSCSITLGAKAATRALALTAKTKTIITTTTACCYVKRVAMLCFLVLLSVAQLTPITPATTNHASSGTHIRIAPKLLPHALLTSFAIVLNQASLIHAGINVGYAPTTSSSSYKIIPTTTYIATYEPHLMHYSFPADREELTEMDVDADADALVQVQVKRINLLDNEDDASDDDVAAMPPSADNFEQEQEQKQDVVVSEQQEDALNEDEIRELSIEDEQQLAQQSVNLKLSNGAEEQMLIFYRHVQPKSNEVQQQYNHAKSQHSKFNYRQYYQQRSDDVESPPTDDLSSTHSSRELDSNAMHKHVTKRSATTKLTSTTVSTPKATNTSTALTSNSTSNGTVAGANSTVVEEKCEPKVLNEVPPEPFFDFSDIAEDTARQFTEFITTKFGTSGPPSYQAITPELREELRRRANGIASYALNEDENLLAFAIAAPSIQTVVVKFRDDVTIPPDQVHSKTFLGSYWRELGVAWNSTEGTQEWGAPFRDCNLLKGRWLWPFRVTFIENKIKIGAAAFIAADEDVCNDGLEEVFGRKHGCDRNTTFCLLTENKPAATRDVYTCICHESYYLPNSTLQGYRGDIVEASEGHGNYSCIPCPDGCSTCDQHGVCLLGEPVEVVSMESLLNVSVGSVLGACILCCIVLSVIVFRQRKCKAIASGMWTVLETILLGIILLYASVTVHFFPATTERCLLEPWLRELGFITCYGAIILKLYRHLVDFRTRKAHRWVLRDIDLLKYLGTMVFAVTCYMAAFTAAALDLIDVSQLGTLREQRTNTCLPLKWEYVTQVSEVLILCFGLHLAFASRNANTQFRERQFLVATLAIEFLVSAAFYVLRFFYLPEMSPSAIFLALFLRSQLTNTMALGLIFVPKLWYQHKQVNDPQRLGGGYAGLCLGDPDIGELTIAEMSPEDIRAELKRLYTQLEILKNKTLRQDNPHISKRRGGRKAGHRRFSLQALSAKHRSNKHHQDIEITEAEPSRTPEDSVCSVEGPTDGEISGVSHSMLSHSAISHSMVSHSK